MDEIIAYLKATELNASDQPESQIASHHDLTGHSTVQPQGILMKYGEVNLKIEWWYSAKHFAQTPIFISYKKLISET